MICMTFPLKTVRLTFILQVRARFKRKVRDQSLMRTRTHALIFQGTWNIEKLGTGMGLPPGDEARNQETQCHFKECLRRQRVGSNTYIILMPDYWFLNKIGQWSTWHQEYTIERKGEPTNGTIDLWDLKVVNIITKVMTLHALWDLKFVNITTQWSWPASVEAQFSPDLLSVTWQPAGVW